MMSKIKYPCLVSTSQKQAIISMRVNKYKFGNRFICIHDPPFTSKTAIIICYIIKPVLEQII
ncbi:unnamed protein product [Paramecium sonneborni]|uniref:Uncharacterized protein n=1 Tax=Paramecium sonneborni TaxID=65129 RepID=A0A8S1MH88_9CILI|nr:unnamed protein product [Paramecium sonneborni]